MVSNLLEASPVLQSNQQGSVRDFSGPASECRGRQMLWEKHSVKAEPGLSLFPEQERFRFCVQRSFSILVPLVPWYPAQC